MWFVDEEDGVLSYQEQVGDIGFAVFITNGEVSISVKYPGKNYAEGGLTNSEAVPTGFYEKFVEYVKAQLETKDV